MDTTDSPRTRTGLTLLEAEQRIDSLEMAAAKAVVIMAETLRREAIAVKELRQSLIEQRGRDSNK